jgi:DNA gyrase subunit A
MPVSGISEQGRATQGVKLIRLDEGDEIAAITRIEDQGQNGNGDNGSNGNHLNGNDNATGADENPSTGGENE